MRQHMSLIPFQKPPTIGQGWAIGEVISDATQQPTLVRLQSLEAAQRATAAASTREEEGEERERQTPSTCGHVESQTQSRPITASDFSGALPAPR